MNKTVQCDFWDLSLIYQSTQLSSQNHFQNKSFCRQQNEAITWISFSTRPIFLPLVINQPHRLHLPFSIHFQALFQVAKHIPLRKQNKTNPALLSKWPCFISNSSSFSPITQKTRWFPYTDAQRVPSVWPTEIYWSKIVLPLSLT